MEERKQKRSKEGGTDDICPKLHVVSFNGELVNRW